jgi:hypothetical protein
MTGITKGGAVVGKAQAPCKAAHIHADPNTDGTAICQHCGWSFEAHDAYRQYHKIGEWAPLDTDTLNGEVSQEEYEALADLPPVLFPSVVVAGRKDDKGKPDYTLLPFGALDDVVKVLTFGANKYARDNWRKVPNADIQHPAAAFRHIRSRLLGERLDPESGLPHVAHAVCRLLFWLELDT